MQLFYTPDITENNCLPEDESMHCVRVLRKKEGDLLDLCDGKGSFYRARILEAHPKRCVVTIEESLPAPIRSHRFIVAVAPTKNLDRMEWLVEKLTEIGVDEIHFLKTHFSERKVLKTERIRKIAISAMKQSERATLPLISELTDYQAFLKQDWKLFNKFICHCHTNASLGERIWLKKCTLPHNHSLMLIGPEGDFSIEEVSMAKEKGFLPVSLGDRRLRTETAALVAMLQLQFLAE